MSFKEWHNNADMPMRDEKGNWYDAEDGLHYESTSTRQSTELVSKTGIEALKIAKFYGGKALKGSAKQKAWAEQIRAEKIQSKKLTEQQIKDVLETGSFVDTAEFWIENRELDASLFTYETILAEYKKLREFENTYSRSEIDSFLNKRVFKIKSSVAGINSAHKELMRKERLRAMHAKYQR